MNEIGANTKISLFAVLSALCAIMGGTFWLAAVDSKATTATDVNLKQEQRIEKQTDLLLEINERVIRIEELLKHTRDK